MIVVAFPLLLAIVGALVYALSSNGKVVQLAYAAYCVGLFWLVYFASHAQFRF